MPTTPLTSTQLNDLSGLLHQRHHALSLVVQRELHADGAPELAVVTASDADWASADVDADAFITRAERNTSELTEVTSALDRVQAGRYGVCETCGEGIGFTRLLVHPAARRCLPCQQAVEADGNPAASASRRPR